MLFRHHPQRRRVLAHPDPVDPANPPCQPRRGSDQTGQLLPRGVAQCADSGKDPRRVAGPVEHGFVLQRADPVLGIDREEADGAAPRTEPGRAEVRVEGPDGEAVWCGRRAERGGGIREDGMAESGEEAGLCGVEREREGRRGSSRGGGTARWGGGGEKREECEVLGEGGGAECAGEGDALGTERATEGGGGGRGRGREGGDAGAAEGVTTRQHARHSGCGVEGAEAHRTLRRVRVRRRRGARHGRRFGSASAAQRKVAAETRVELCGLWARVEVPAPAD